MPAVLKLFGSMDQFRGRQFFHGSWGKGMEGWFGDESVHYTYCAVYFYYDYISSTLDQQALDPRVENPWIHTGK